MCFIITTQVICNFFESDEEPVEVSLYFKQMALVLNTLEIIYQ